MEVFPVPARTKVQGQRRPHATIMRGYLNFKGVSERKPCLEISSDFVGVCTAHLPLTYPAMTAEFFWQLQKTCLGSQALGLENTLDCMLTFVEVHEVSRPLRKTGTYLAERRKTWQARTARSSVVDRRHAVGRCGTSDE